MKVLMLMDNNSYPGREYLSRLIGLNIDVAIFGKYPIKRKVSGMEINNTNIKRIYDIFVNNPRSTLNT